MTRGQSLPLAAFREQLDEGSARSRWLVDPDGVLGRVLEVAAGARYTVPLALDGPVSLRTKAMLFPHDWRDRGGAVRAIVAVCRAGGDRDELWAGTLRTGDRGKPSGAEVACELPADATALVLEVHPLRRPPDDAVARMIWVEPSLVDPHAGGAVHRPADRTAVGAPVSGEGPLFSVLVPVHDPPAHVLAEAIESVRGQTFSDWELCIVDDGSADPAVRRTLERYAREDPRIRLGQHEAARGISAATNTALGLAGGRYIALLDHDDTLAPDALERIAATIAADPRLDMVYSDEDIVDGDRQIWVHLKPGWSPDTLRTNGYTCHLGVYRRSLVQEIGGFRSEFDGSQDIDMILRLTERSDRVAHVPQILYHWRAHAASTAGGNAKPYAYVAGRGAYAAHLERTGLAGTVGYGPPGLYRLATPIEPATTIAIALAASSAVGLAAAARSWATQPHAHWHATVAIPDSERGAAEAELTRAGLATGQVEIVRADRDPAVAQATVAGRAADSGAVHVLVLQNAAVGLTHDWLARLAGYGEQPGIAAAGPIVLAPDGRVADGGVALPDGLVLHLLHGARTSMDDFFGYGTSVYNVSALSGALLTPAAVYRELGGLDPSLRGLALVEYCLRACESGRRIVTVPDVRLRLSAPDCATNDLAALRALSARWSHSHAGDPFYNAGYRTDRGDFSRRAG